MPADHGTFGTIAGCDPSGRDSHTAAADLDGTLFVSSVSFPYFFLLAVEAGSLLRGAALLLLCPIVFLVYKFLSEEAGIQIMIYVSVAGIPISDIELVARAVLPRFYAADVRADSYRIFRACRRRRVVVTANPTVMVEPFVKEYLGGDRVLGTELEVNRRTGKATGMVTGAGVLVGGRKRDAVKKEFGDDLPDLGIGDRESDHAFMAICKAQVRPALGPDHNGGSKNRTGILSSSSELDSIQFAVTISSCKSEGEYLLSWRVQLLSWRADFCEIKSGPLDHELDTIQFMRTGEDPSPKKSPLYVPEDSFL
ncbi:Glycerol-3-phosphate 2-O-acyltransferase 4 [Platanthera guangdongensis]|uniref:Glycerol-3-phosphate 2-O-acyltransferase 4 n=1 Tax=Platanthera guangdongensis TaxID=2320717 RepID=A0ABR2MKF7_9ASPA